MNNMKRFILFSVIVSASILLGGCTGEVKPQPPVVVTTPTPSMTPVVNAEDPEVKVITDELDALDSQKDFPAYSVKDIQ